MGTFSGTNDGIFIDGNCTSNPGFTGVRFSLLNTTANATGSIRIVRATGSSYLGMQITSQSRDGISFNTHATTPVENMRLDASGSLLLGTTTNSGFKLNVSGNTLIQGNLTVFCVSKYKSLFLKAHL